VVQRRSSLCLSLETRQSLRVFGNHIRQELQSHEAVELDVFGLVKHTHPAAAELFEDAVVRNGLAYHGRETLSLMTNVRTLSESKSMKPTPERMSEF